MSVEEATTDLFDPTTSPLQHFGHEVRLARERVGMSRAELGTHAHCGYSLVAKIEVGERVPTLYFAESCDRAFPHSYGRFERLWQLVIKHAYPTWFRPWVVLEEAATAIRSFQVQLVPGLLQTEDYARAVLSCGRLTAERVEVLLTARMERQRILTRDTPPDLWAVLDENVLRRQVAPSKAFAGQLARLIEESEKPSTLIQVVPYGAGAHAGLGGPFSALTMEEGPDVLYVDGFAQGQILADPEVVKAALRTYDLLQAVALSPSASVDLIHTVMKELN
ncbi:MULTISPECIES: helix-turn-helix domain-containing protein [unclassified Streptomyces]|uniref:helix-turn-helix domain-containing protein n=1 Tax=unclassified Streptomyces TaxID=2593676 RepID=UPI002E29D652|nr:helix-turn-helix transcriptional regulator [Streptomyces sp. NBC_00223]